MFPPVQEVTQHFFCSSRLSQLNQPLLSTAPDYSVRGEEQDAAPVPPFGYRLDFYYKGSNSNIFHCLEISLP